MFMFYMKSIKPIHLGQKYCNSTWLNKVSIQECSKDKKYSLLAVV